MSPGSVRGALAIGTPQGITAFVNDISAGVAGVPSSLPNLSQPNLTAIAGTGGPYTLATGMDSALASPDTFIATLTSANSRITNALTAAGATAYATLLPTADIGTALAVSAPSYDLTLFLNGVQQVVNGDRAGGLIYAFGAPLAADVALDTLAGGFEFRVLAGAATQIVGDLQKIA